MVEKMDYFKREERKDLVFEVVLWTRENKKKKKESGGKTVKLGVIVRGSSSTIDRQKLWK